MIERALAWFNEKGMKCATSYKRQIEEMGGGYRIISNGDNNPSLSKVFELTALGLRLEPPLSVGGLTDQEKLAGTRKGKILTITDFDGVMVSPLHSVLNALCNRDSLKKEGRISNDNLRWFRQLVALSDWTAVCTSRFWVPDRIKGIIPKFFQGKIMYFPFFDSTSIKSLEKIGESGDNHLLSVHTNKNFIRSHKQIAGIIQRLNNNGEDFDMIYYIGSSNRDREAVLQLLERHPELAEKFVFIDTCHWLL